MKTKRMRLSEARRSSTPAFVPGQANYLSQLLTGFLRNLQSERIHDPFFFFFFVNCCSIQLHTPKVFPYLCAPLSHCSIFSLICVNPFSPFLNLQASSEVVGDKCFSANSRDGKVSCSPRNPGALIPS